jgi:hypothetical protein
MRKSSQNGWASGPEFLLNPFLDPRSHGFLPLIKSVTFSKGKFKIALRKALWFQASVFGQALPPETTEGQPVA